MEIHKPKAVHGWRELLNEVGVVVIGVLIALGAEQAVQAIEWHHKIEAAEDAMREELGTDDGPEVMQRLIMHPCLQAQLDAIASAVNANRPRSEVAALTSGYRLPLLSFDSLAHDAANASDVAAHMTTASTTRWNKAYAMIPVMDRTNEREAQDLALLYGLRRTGGPLSDAERDRLLQAVEALRVQDNYMSESARWTMNAITRAGIRLDSQREAMFAGFARRTYGRCAKGVPLDNGR